MYWFHVHLNFPCFDLPPLNSNYYCVCQPILKVTIPCGQRSCSSRGGALSEEKGGGGGEGTLKEGGRGSKASGGGTKSTGGGKEARGGRVEEEAGSGGRMEEEAGEGGVGGISGGACG